MGTGSSADTQAKAEENAQILRAWRVLINERQHSSSYSISDELKDNLEKDIEKEMKIRAEHFNRSPVVQHNTLHIWFTLARLLALSRGESELTFSTWQAVKDLEMERHVRLASLPPVSSTQA
mmetsp:Transcript_95253/g.164379  ORF Transcript_95253/g.164379 Transcript_95253/m.164379 type:complete len:122 (-) Transcript_95253:743-1108(-)